MASALDISRGIFDMQLIYSCMLGPLWPISILLRRFLLWLDSYFSSVDFLSRRDPPHPPARSSAALPFPSHVG